MIITGQNQIKKLLNGHSPVTSHDKPNSNHFSKNEYLKLAIELDRGCRLSYKGESLKPSEKYRVQL